jgi:hypothetical protein
MYNAGMIHDDLPLYESTVGMSNHIEQPRQIFFFERNDGKVLAVEGQEAWSMYSRRAQNLSKRTEFKLIGTGDGKIFAEARLRAQIAGKTDINEARKILAEGHQAELEACRGKIIAPRPGALDKILA